MGAPSSPLFTTFAPLCRSALVAHAPFICPAILHLDRDGQTLEPKGSPHLAHEEANVAVGEAFCATIHKQRETGWS